MRKNLLMFASVAIALLTVATASAQAPKAYKITADDSPNPPAYALPYTTVKVRVVMQKETVRTGPYARFAQKYLGVIAPLNDKSTYTIQDTKLDYADPDREPAAESAKPDARHRGRMEQQADFPKLLPDRMALGDKSQEDMAREAANMIFKLRRTRIDLITGEVGEHVYGAGLESALDEITRLENEYLELFLGKRSVTNVVREFDVVPETGKNSYIVFRYSEDAGFLPATDLGGSPIVLMLAPEGKAPAGGAAKKGGSYYRVADWVGCRVMDGTDELASARLPIYQFGATVAGK